MRAFTFAFPCSKTIGAVLAPDAPPPASANRTNASPHPISAKAEQRDLGTSATCDRRALLICRPYGFCRSSFNRVLSGYCSAGPRGLLLFLTASSVNPVLHG